MSGSSGGFGKGSSSSRTRVQIPDFLRPLLNQSAGTAQNALSNVQNLANGNLVAGFDPFQNAAQGLGAARAFGQGGFIPAAQQTFLDAANGQDISSFIPSFGTLSGASQGQGIESYLSPEALNTLRQATGGAGGLDILSQLGGGSGIPASAMNALAGLSQGGQVPGQDILSQLGAGSGIPASAMNALAGLSQSRQLPGQDILSQLGGGNGVPASAMNALAALSQGGQLPGMDVLSQLGQSNPVDGATLNTLQRTASGDFLYGGDAFDQAVDAAVRAAAPGVLSTFGRAGAGGATGGLAQTAIAQSGIDAFARQYAQERQNQLGAANTLSNLGLQTQGQRADIASSLANLGLAQGNQNLNAASALGNLGLQGFGQQADVASVLANLGLAQGNQNLNAASALGNLGLQGVGQQADIASVLANLGISQGNQQLNAASALGNLGLQGAGQQADIASTLAGFGLNAANSLAGFGSDERNRQLAAAGQLGDFGLAERANQLRAAGILPDLALADVNILGSIGEQRQDLAQQRLDTPFNAQLQLLSAALGGLPISSLLGQNTSGRQSSAFIGWQPPSGAGV